MKYTIEDYLNETLMGEGVKEKVKDIAGKVAGATTGAAKKVAGAASTAGKAVAGTTTAAAKKVAGAASTASKAVAGLPGKAKGMSQAQWDKLSPGQKKAVKIGAPTALALGGGALAYRKFFSKAAKACKDKKGAEKAACMKKFRAGATEAAIMALEDGKFHCDESKNTKKCYNRVAEAIEQLRMNLEVLYEG